MCVISWYVIYCALFVSSCISVVFFRFHFILFILVLFYFIYPVFLICILLFYLQKSINYVHLISSHLLVISSLFYPPHPPKKNRSIYIFFLFICAHTVNSRDKLVLRGITLLKMQAYVYTQAYYYYQHLFFNWFYLTLFKIISFQSVLFYLILHIFLIRFKFKFLFSFVSMFYVHACPLHYNLYH